MVGSLLSVHIVEARDLTSMYKDGTSDPYVRITLEGQEIESNVKKGTLNPVWNESFTFEILHGRESMKVMVMDKDTFGNDDFKGQTEIDMEQLRDQMKHDMWYDLVEKDG